jgi:transcriptional antiterminator NusG
MAEDFSSQSNPADPAHSATEQAQPPADDEQAARSAQQADDSAQDQSASEDKTGAGGADEPLVTPGMNWFVLRVASNKEHSVQRTILRKVKIEGYQHIVNRIVVPTEKQKTIKAGKQRIIEEKLYPGYVFVEMALDEEGRIPQDVFFLFKETSGVGDFIGTAGRPSPMSMPEVEKMLQAAKPPEEQPEVKMEFQVGEHVKIKEGPFENMEGTVDELLPEQGKVRVNVTIFGRSTPIELEYWLIEKFEE